ncbi:MAG: type II secretion system protein GspK [Candidatus Ratteibacteria bacterium]|nr:type II secretion system protein GspK [Candidatus Ratteibacteria bacterium]
MSQKSNEGVILIFVLIFATAISALAIFLSGKAKQYITLFSGMQEDIEMENIAEMGTEMGKVLLDIAQKKHIISEVPGYIEKHYEIDGKELEIVIEDENGKINPNKIFGPEKGEINTHLMDIYKMFFTLMGYKETLADALLDWIDEDDMPRPQGAESLFYKTSDLSYLPANRPIYSPEEMLLVAGFTEDIVFGNDEKKGLFNFITSFSDGKINVNTCQPEVLNGLGFSVADIEKITAERLRRPLEERFLLEVNKEVYLKNRPVIVFKSSYFTIYSCVKNEEGDKKELKAYIKQSDKKMKTIRMDIR